MRNLILCLLFNLKKCQSSQNMRNYFWNICQKYWELSEYHYTLLPTSEHFLIRKRTPDKHFMMAISILTTHLISSIPAWPKFFHYKMLTISRKKIYIKMISFIKAMKVVYFLIFFDDNEYSDAFLLQTQRWIPDQQFYWDGSKQFQLCRNKSSPEFKIKQQT